MKGGRWFPGICTVLALLISCGGSRNAGTRVKMQTGTISQFRLPDRYTYRVEKIYPHDANAYTQGLFWYKGKLYEGTGLYGASQLRRVAIESGQPDLHRNLDAEYFGEGIALLDGRIYQLTWMEGKCFVYDADDFRLLKTFTYDGEGWGLTSDGEKLYMSDGSDCIRVIDPETFEVERTIRVMMGRNRLKMLNELEWIDGRIWANLYMSDLIVCIDPVDGRVEKTVDLEGLLPFADRTPDTDVLNGIAWDPDGCRLFVTGKNWNKLFEIVPVEEER